MDVKNIIDIKNRVRYYLEDTLDYVLGSLCDKKYIESPYYDQADNVADKLIPDGKVDPEFDAKLFDTITDPDDKEGLQEILRPLTSQEDKESKSRSK